jgi:3-keto-5-aminohexanoate cleavage enzyme
MVTIVSIFTFKAQMKPSSLTSEVPMTNPCIICIAITGSVPTQADNPAVPVTVSEQIESTHAAFEAGASIAHCHVRDDAGNPTSDPERFARLKEGIEGHCPGMVIQLSTGGRSGAGRDRGGMLTLKPDMASLSVGSNNFPTRIYENSPDLVDWLASEMITYDVKPEIEAFDLSHIFHAALMHKRGQLTGTPYVQFVMGVKNAMPADRTVFDFYRATVARLFGDDAPWCAAGVGPNQIVLNEWAISTGGHARTGLEDNIRINKNALAPSNAALVQRAVDLCEKYERPVATWQQAREILGLRKGAA